MVHCGEEQRPSELQAADSGNRPLHWFWGELPFWGGAYQGKQGFSKYTSAKHAKKASLFPDPAPQVFREPSRVGKAEGVTVYPKQNSDKLTLGSTESPQDLWSPREGRRELMNP